MQCQVSSFSQFGPTVAARLILTNPNPHIDTEGVYALMGETDVPNAKNHLMLLTWFFADQDGHGG
jgi:hypothetical protein